MRPTLVETHKSHVVHRYRDGDSPRDISSDLNISLSTVYKILRISHIRSGSKVDINESAVVDLFQNGWAVSDISSRFGVGIWIIYRILRKNNLKPSGKRSCDYRPHNKIAINIDDVKRLHSEGKTTKEISSILRCKKHLISSRLRKLGLKPNVRWNEATNLKSQIGQFAYDRLIDREWLFHKYVNLNLSTRQIARELGCGKKTVNTFISKYGFNKHDVKISRDEFIERANKIHNHKYDYSNVEYESYQKHVLISCPEHGDFWQLPQYHIQNRNGCPSCAGTHLQYEIYNFINGLTCDTIINNSRSVIYPEELDILVPRLSIAIEVNGMYWHSFNHVESNMERNRHVHKLDKCIDKGISLIQIAEYEWREKRPVVESMLLNKFGLSQKIYARQCYVRPVEAREYREFVDSNHLQGYRYSNVIYGLEFQNELVAVMSFNKHNKYGWEITRFCNKLDASVVGGASRLFKNFLNEHNPDRVLTYADRRYSDGNLYKQLGFEFDGMTKPNYIYIKGLNHYSRQKFQKHKLKTKLKNFDPDLTEAQNMFNNGYRRMWDAGHYRFVWSQK